MAAQSSERGDPGDPARHRARAWGALCAHSTGLALSSTVASLRQRGVLDRLAGTDALTMAQIRAEAGGNPGHLHIALALLVSQGWATRQGPPATDEMAFTLTPRGRIAVRLAEAYDQGVACLPEARRLPAFLLDPGAPAAGASPLRPWLDRVARRWDLPRDGMDDETRALSGRIATHLDGHLVAPVLAAFHAGGLLSRLEAAPAGVEVAELGPHPDRLEDALALLEGQGWLQRAGSRAALTPLGLVAARMSTVCLLPVSYLPMLMQIPELLFGDATVLSARTGDGQETHLDRSLDIDFSGQVARRYCGPPMVEVLRELFDTRPLEQQPRAVVDMGSGNGQLLVDIHRIVSTETRRGQHLDRYPLVMVGVDPAEVARHTTRRNLEAAGATCRVATGDIDDPAALARTLADLDLDLRDALHVSKSVIHDRTYRPPRDLEAAARRPGLSAGVFADEEGRAIPVAHLEQNLVEHFARWVPFVPRHGLLVFEAHVASPEVAAQHVGLSPATMFCATQCYSHQYPVEMEVLTRTAQDAGLRVHRQVELTGQIFGHPQLSMTYLTAGGSGED